MAEIDPLGDANENSNGNQDESLNESLNTDLGDNPPQGDVPTGKGEDNEPVPCEGCAQRDEEIAALRQQVATFEAEVTEPSGKAKPVRLKARYIAAGHFGTIMFKKDQVVTDPITIKLLRGLRAPIARA